MGLSCSKYNFLRCSSHQLNSHAKVCLNAWCKFEIYSKKVGEGVGVDRRGGRICPRMLIFLSAADYATYVGLGRYQRDGNFQEEMATRNN